MNADSLTDEIIRLQKLVSDEKLREELEEAAQLAAEGNHLEAEALVQNAGARIRQAREAAPVDAIGRSGQPVSPLAG